MKHFVYSDPHFNHGTIIRNTGRPFESISEMNNELIRRFNEVVSTEDKVFILGDFGFFNLDEIKDVVSQLNGYKVLIMGNHDRNKPRSWWLEAGFNEVHKDPILIQKLFLLSHEPLIMSDDMPYYNIHGHTHNAKQLSRKHLNVSVEATEYAPIPVHELVKRIKRQNLSLSKKTIDKE